MTLKLHCPGTWNYFLLKNQTLENIRPFHLGTGWKHQNWLLKMWHFLNLVFILLGMLIGWEMDTFCILSEQALNRQWNFDFVHSSTACILLRKGGTRPGWKATLRGLAVTSLFQGGGARKNNRSRRDLQWLQYPSLLTEIHSTLFFVTWLSLPQGSVATCLVFSLVRGLTALDSLVPSFMYLLSGKYSNH